MLLFLHQAPTNEQNDRRQHHLNLGIPGTSYGQSIKFSDASAEIKPALLNSEHTDYVCRELLGLLYQEIAEAVIDGAIES